MYLISFLFLEQNHVCLLKASAPLIMLLGHSCCFKIDVFGGNCASFLEDILVSFQKRAARLPLDLGFHFTSRYKSKTIHEIAVYVKGCSIV